MPLEVVTRRGTRNLYVRGTCCGKSVYESTKVSNRTLAEAYRVNLENQIQTAHVYRKKDAITFAEAAAMYMESGGGREHMTAIIKAVGLMKVDQFRQSDLDALALKLRPKVSNATRNREVYTPFIAVMNYAANSDFCPLRKWRRPKQQEKKRNPRFADFTEMAFFYNAASEHIKLLIVLLTYTGLRMGEAINLLWPDVDLDKKWAIIRKTKTGKQRGVPLHRAVIKELSKITDRTGHVLRSRGGKAGYVRNYRGGNIARKSRDRASHEGGLEHITWHDLRHTCATWLQMAGIDRETRQDILGHSRGAVHDTYIHVPQARLIEAINKLEDCTDFSLLK